MTFAGPRVGQPLTVKVGIAFGYNLNTANGSWVFTDVTPYVRAGITFSVGSSTQGTEADPAQIQFTLDNNDGRFTALNPNSPYWPNVVRNVPVKVTVTWQGAATTYELITAFIDGWPILPNDGISDVVVPITASSRMRRTRLQSGPTFSAMRRSTTALTALAAYWPLENQDLQDVETGRKCTIAGDATWAAVDSTAAAGFWGSDTLPTLTTGLQGGFVGTTNHTYAVNTDWTLDWNLFIPAAPTSPITIMKTQGNGFADSSVLRVLVDATTISADFLDSGGVVLAYPALSGSSTALFGEWWHFKFTAKSVTGTETTTLKYWRCNADPSTATTLSNVSGLGSTISGPITVTIPGGAVAAGCIIGHVAICDGFNVNGADGATSGWNGELATDRMSRISAENGLQTAAVATGSGGVVAALMGAQLPNTTSTILDEIQEADNGLLVDNAINAELFYTSGSWRYNASTAFSLGYNSHQIGADLSATFDDQTLVTSFTASRSNGGGTDTYVDPTALDNYNKAATINVELDTQLEDYAGWQVHLGTYNAYRIRQVTIDLLGRNPELVQFILVNALLPFRIPQRITLTNLPTPPFPPGSTTFDCFLEGFSCVVDSVMWQYTLNLSPAQPWNVAVVDDGTTGLVAGDTAVLAANITATQTSFTVTTPNLFTTAGGDFPMSINVGGEQMTVSAISGAASPQTFTISARHVNNVTKAHIAGESVEVWLPAVVAYG